MHRISNGLIDDALSEVQDISGLSFRLRCLCLYLCCVVVVSTKAVAGAGQATPANCSALVCNLCSHLSFQGFSPFAAAIRSSVCESGSHSSHQ